ncbi:MAG: hypothetical protein ACKN81_19310, partial [Pirellulaceae bacterium]
GVFSESSTIWRWVATGMRSLSSTLLAILVCDCSIHRERPAAKEVHERERESDRKKRASVEDARLWDFLVRRLATQYSVSVTRPG